ncbi:MAG: CBS domain-containing protein, partial [Candidatus Nanohalobium sp.]
MTSAREINAKEVVNENPFTVKADQTVSKIRDKMEERNLRAVAVTDEKNRLQGAISYRDLIRHVQFNPDKTKLSKVTHSPPEFDIKD